MVGTESEREPAPAHDDRPRLVISGASGVVGRHLIKAARVYHDYDVTILTRSVDGGEPEGVKAVAWDPDAAGAVSGSRNEAALDALAEVLDGSAALVNLAGASIADGRLGDEHRRRVRDSRVASTHTLVEAARRSAAPPAVWLQGSAVGYYGDRGDEVLDADAGPQPGFFLSEVGMAWEREAEPAAEFSRLVTGRIGLVLAEDAPAWQRMLLPIRLFVGGPLGSGQQWFAWIDADDLARAMLFLIGDEGARGAYNLTAPKPVRQIALARAAARRLGRPAVVPAPAFALRLILGGVADMLLLPSTRAVPDRLLGSGFEFHRADLQDEMDALLR